MGTAASTYSRCTIFPAGPVWCVTSFLPNSSVAAARTSSGVVHSLMPPALPRAPEWICAFTTHRPPPISSARYTAWSGVYTTPPLGTATPKPASNSFA